jgi:hypothetical protein
MRESRTDRFLFRKVPLVNSVILELIQITALENLTFSFLISFLSGSSV